MIRKLAALVMIMVLAAILSGCNTIHGMGKDIESLGKNIRKSSDKK